MRNLEIVLTAYSEYVTELDAYQVADGFEMNAAIRHYEEQDARDWNESCKAMLNAEMNHFERFDEHRRETEDEVERFGFSPLW